MEIITVVENGINIVFGIKAEKIYLLHLSDKQVEQESLQKFADDSNIPFNVIE